jgi:hypothetical protein
LRNAAEATGLAERAKRARGATREYCILIYVYKRKKEKNEEKGRKTNK